jgi:hypothetical protein
MDVAQTAPNSRRAKAKIRTAPVVITGHKFVEQSAEGLLSRSLALQDIQEESVREVDALFGIEYSYLFSPPIRTSDRVGQ